MERLVANLRRQFAVPVASGVVAGALLLALGMRDGYALVAYTLAFFVTGTIVQDRVVAGVAGGEHHGDQGWC